MSPRIRLLSVLVSVMLLGLVAPVYAQDNPADPLDLARRLLGFSGEPSIPPPSPAYELGDTETFWVSKAGHDTPIQVEATLAGRGVKAYLWVEDGIPYDEGMMSSMAGRVGLLLDVLRIRDNYPQVEFIPETPRDVGVLSTLRLPDVDNDPHIYVLFTRDLAGGVNTLHNPADSFTADLVPGGYSNQHEMVYVNTSNFPGVTLHDATYFNLLTRQFYAMLAGYNNPGQAPWLVEAVSWYMLMRSQNADIQNGDVAAFFSAPDTPLTRVPGLTSTGSEFGAQQLFLRYVSQRFGQNVLQDMVTGAGAGLRALDDALLANGVTDLVTGDPITADHVFADFVMTNILNANFGDGRYFYTTAAARGQIASIDGAQDQFNFDVPNQLINQYGTRYIALSASQPTTFSLFFEGQENVPRLAMPAGTERNRFYWSGGSGLQQASMTREFDLSGVSSATLNFDAWYSLADSRNYMYVEVSTDGGQTWDILPASDTASTNPYALNYGYGFTGISNIEKPRPFPYLGVGLDTNGITLTEIIEDGPVADTDIQVGDTIIGYDGHVWDEQPNLLAFLSDYEPGDTVNLYIQRDEDTFFDAPIVLGEHPVRRVIPDALWMPQTVDLSPYAGGTILLRFESLRVPGIEDSGIAIDNIAIPEIGFSDDAERGVQGWTLYGWGQLDNQTRGRYLLQAAKITQNRVQVSHLIAPGERTTSGVWEFSLDAGETLVLAISGVSDETTMPAVYNFSFRSQATEVG